MRSSAKLGHLFALANNGVVNDAVIKLKLDPVEAISLSDFGFDDFVGGGLDRRVVWRRIGIGLCPFILRFIVTFILYDDISTPDEPLESRCTM